MSKLEPELIDFQEPEPGYVLAPDGSQKAVWCEGTETGLSHLVTQDVMFDCDVSVCGVVIVRPRPDDTKENPRCSACSEMFAGELKGFF